MNIIMAKTAGFCSGVKRGIDMIEKCLRRPDKAVCALSYPVHNVFVVNELVKKGLKLIDSVDGAAEGDIILVGTHGAGPRLYEQAYSCGLEIMDVTCPMVKRVRKTAMKAAENTDIVVIAGDKNHPEVRSICEWLGSEKSIVVQARGDITNIPVAVSLAIVSQTTFSCVEFDAIIEAIRNSMPDAALTIHRTICPATYKRQDEVIELAGVVDRIFVVGDTRSANSCRLVELASSKGVPAKLVGSPGEITVNDLEGAESIGITAGASTPDELITQCRNRILELADEMHKTAAV